MSKTKRSAPGTNLAIKDLLGNPGDTSDGNQHKRWYVIVSKFPIAYKEEKITAPAPPEFDDERILKAIEKMVESGSEYSPLDTAHSLHMLNFDSVEESPMNAVERMYEEQFFSIKEKIRKRKLNAKVYKDPKNLFFRPYALQEKERRQMGYLIGKQFALWIPEIRTLRALTGMTQIDFGDRYMIPMRSIQNWESGDRTSPKYVRYLLMTNVIADLRRSSQSGS